MSPVGASCRKFVLMHWNNIKTTLLLVLVAWAGVPTSGQAQDWDDWDDLNETYVPARKGIEFALNFGVYQGNHKAANAFYNGLAGEFYELRDNTANLMTIEQRLGIDSPNSQVWSQVMSSVGLEAGEFKYIEYPGPDGMRYTPGTLMGLQTLLFFNPESALVLHIDAINGLKSEGGWNIVSSDVDTGQGSERRTTYGIFSKENRFQLSLGYRSAAYITDEISWVFELGGNLLATQMESNFVRVMNQNYQLLTAQVGNQFTGPTSSLTATGYGAFAALGVELFFAEGGNLMLTVRGSRDQVKMGTYEANLMHGALYLTWVIPPQVGDFVRAKF